MRASREFRRRGKFITVATGFGLTALLVAQSIAPLARAAVMTPAAFLPRQSRPVAGPAMWTACADFNGDGRVDIAVGSNGASALTTFYTQPNGTLPATGSMTATATVPTRLSAGDFNADGKSDLLYLEGNAGMKLRYGQADNTFSAPTTIGPARTGVSWGRTAVADLNRDGRLDAMIAISNSTIGTGSVATAHALAGGGFSMGGVATNSDPNGVTTADLNGDGHPDIIIGDNHGGSGVKVAYGSASGSFTVKSFTYGDRGYAAVSRDFNGDGIPDVALPAWNHGAVGVLLTQPNGDLSPATFFATTSTPDDIASGEFNGDGVADLVVSSQGGSTASVLLGNGDGTFGSRLDLSASANGSSTVSVADLDFNGLDDIAIAAASGQKLDLFYNANSIPEPGGVAGVALIVLGHAMRRRMRVMQA